MCIRELHDAVAIERLREFLRDKFFLTYGEPPWANEKTVDCHIEQKKRQEKAYQVAIVATGMNHPAITESDGRTDSIDSLRHDQNA